MQATWADFLADALSTVLPRLLGALEPRLARLQQADLFAHLTSLSYGNDARASLCFRRSLPLGYLDLAPSWYQRHVYPGLVDTFGLSMSTAKFSGSFELLWPALASALLEEESIRRTLGRRQTAQDAVPLGPMSALEGDRPASYRRATGWWQDAS